MIKRIIIVAITMLIASESISQTSKDTICIPIVEIKKSINLIERGKVAEKELLLSKEAIILLEKRILVKDSIIAEFKTKEKTYLEIQDNYDALVFSSNEIAQNLEKSLVLANRKYKRQGFMKWVGVAAAFSIGYLISK